MERCVAQRIPAAQDSLRRLLALDEHPGRSDTPTLAGGNPMRVLACYGPLQ